MVSTLNLLVLIGILVASGTAQTADPCNAVAGMKYMIPSAFRACLKSFPFDEKIRQNVLTNVIKILEGFYTFLEYYDKSPPPFEESTVDIFGELKRINETEYATDYDFSWDLYRTTNELNDAHTKWYPDCYLTTESILPAPVISLLSNGTESLFIAPDLNDLVPMIGTDFISYLSSLNFNYTRLAGAKIISIDGLSAYDYVDKVAREESGNFLDHGIRVNSVYTSYRIAHGVYSQRLGDLAGPPGVERDSLKMTVVLDGSEEPEEIDIPYVGHFAGWPFTDSATYWSKDCLPGYSTNGYDVKGSATPLTEQERQPMGKILEVQDRSAIYINPLLLPDKYYPTLDADLWSGDQLWGYILPGSSTGVLFIGGFDSIDFYDFQRQLARMILDFQDAGVTHLIIDLTDNPGGAVCLGQFVYKYLMGSNYVDNPGFESTMRASPIARKIVDADISFGLTSTWLFYTPDNYAFLNNTRMNKTVDYMEPVVYEEINGKHVPVTPRYYDTCSRWYIQEFPTEPPFPLENIVIVGNGWCGSTCAMFATAMAEKAGTPIVTFGGKPGGAPMEYKGCAGNQVLDWYYLSTEIKSADLENDPDAPPDLIVGGDFRVNWRNAYSWKDKSKPIAYLSDISTYRFPYTIDTYMNPQNLWIYV
ncbi:hypothetical protein DL96DRAFT_1468622 [Flagelloscypha sp. PMI_526]|nr:hypothetical protein DL96DRAFT_1468622 [Flagelloscypha sp. PMI_526]